MVIGCAVPQDDVDGHDGVGARLRDAGCFWGCRGAAYDEGALGYRARFAGLWGEGGGGD